MTHVPLLVGIDLGTSAVKVAAYGPDGRPAAIATREYPMATPRPNWAEQNPEDWWRATVSALRTVCRNIDPSRVAGVSFSGQMHGAVFLDRNDEVIRPCILWCDGRTSTQCAHIVETLGKQAFLKTIKNLPLPSFTLPKLLWLREHEPKAYGRLRTILLPKDYVRFRMTGVKCMDEADGAGTVMMAVGRKRWASAILERLGVDPAVLPPLVHSITVTGGLSAEVARATGLPTGTPIVAGGGDQPVGAVGAGVVREGQAMVGLGTSGVVFAPTARAHVADAGGLASFDHAVPGVSYLMGCVMSAGGALQWFRNTLAPGVSYDNLTAEAVQAPPGAEGLLFAPYLMGERTPHADPDARGAFVGLSTRHSRAHLTRAVIEGVTFGLRDALELIRDRHGVQIEEVRVTGGGARSRLWLRTLADVFALPVRPLGGEEGPALGAALLAGVGTGVYRDFAQASRRAVRLGRALRPNARRMELYEAAYARFRTLYPALRETFVSH